MGLKYYSVSALTIVALVCGLLAGLASVVQYFVLELSLGLPLQLLLVVFLVAFATLVIFNVGVRIQSTNVLPGTRRVGSHLPKHPIKNGVRRESEPTPRTLYPSPNQDQRELRTLMSELVSLEDQFATELSLMKSSREN